MSKQPESEAQRALNDELYTELSVEELEDRLELKDSSICGEFTKNPPPSGGGSSSTSFDYRGSTFNRPPGICP